MTGKLDLSPRASFLGVKEVDEHGTIRGLDAHRGRQFLLFRLPPYDATALDELRRMGEEVARDLARRAERWEREAEERAARVAKDLDIDPERARSMVRAGTGGVVDTLRHLGGEAPGEPEASRAAHATASDVAGSIRGGVSSLTGRTTGHGAVAREAREEQHAILDAARAAKAGAAGWGPGEGPDAPEPRRGGGARGEDVTDRIRSEGEGARRARGWEPGAGGP